MNTMMMPGSNSSGREEKEKFDFYYVPPPIIVMDYSVDKTMRRLKKVLSMKSVDHHVLLMAYAGSGRGSLSMKGRIQSC